MGLSFRKSVKIAPGVKLNLGKKSAGISVGGKYGGMSFNSKGGVRARTSIPGTGLSYTTGKIGAKGSRPSSSVSTGSVELPENYAYKKFWVLVLLCVFLGWMGIHRFYAGKIGTGIIWLFTCGCFVFGWLRDIAVIISGNFYENNGAPFI